MIEIQIRDFQVGKTYYLHQVKDEDTHEPLAVTRKYKAVCIGDHCIPGGWYDFTFGNVKGINTQDIPGRIGISINEYVGVCISFTYAREMRSSNESSTE